ncbi:MAG: hypothetical protein M3P18_23470, partial [Actinomycetota bacterium]|nr:hypothetical protein [Actinomycetota bacterium]
RADLRPGRAGQVTDRVVRAGTQPATVRIETNLAPPSRPTHSLPKPQPHKGRRHSGSQSPLGEAQGHREPNAATHDGRESGQAGLAVKGGRVDEMAFALSCEGPDGAPWVVWPTNLDVAPGRSELGTATRKPPKDGRIKMRVLRSPIRNTNDVEFEFGDFDMRGVPIDLADAAAREMEAEGNLELADAVRKVFETNQRVRSRPQ